MDPVAIDRGKRLGGRTGGSRAPWLDGRIERRHSKVAQPPRAALAGRPCPRARSGRVGPPELAIPETPRPDAQASAGQIRAFLLAHPNDAQAAKFRELHDRRLWPCDGLRRGAAECAPDFAALRAQPPRSHERVFARLPRLVAIGRWFWRCERQLEALVLRLETERTQREFEGAIDSREFVTAARLLSDAEVSRAAEMGASRSPPACQACAETRRSDRHCSDAGSDVRCCCHRRSPSRASDCACCSAPRNATPELRSRLKPSATQLRSP